MGLHWHHLANAVAKSTCSSDRALCQIPLNTRSCYRLCVCSVTSLIVCWQVVQSVRLHLWWTSLSTASCPMTLNSVETTFFRCTIPHKLSIGLTPPECTLPAQRYFYSSLTTMWPAYLSTFVLDSSTEKKNNSSLHRTTFVVFKDKPWYPQCFDGIDWVTGRTSAWNEALQKF